MRAFDYLANKVPGIEAARRTAERDAMRANEAIKRIRALAAKSHAVTIADDGRSGEVRDLGEIDNSPDGVRKLVAKLRRQYERLHFWYEAGPTGYGLHRQLAKLGYVCDVVAPTMIPKRTGDPVKTNRRGRLKKLGRVPFIMTTRLSPGARFRRQSLVPRGATPAGVGD